MPSFRAAHHRGGVQWGDAIHHAIDVVLGHRYHYALAQSSPRLVELAVLGG